MWRSERHPVQSSVSCVLIELDRCPPWDRFVAGDWDHDGRTDIGVRPPAAKTFALRQGDGSVSRIGFGRLETKPVAGDWNGEAPPPPLPVEVVEATSGRYLEAFRLITGRPLEGTA